MKYELTVCTHSPKSTYTAKVVYGYQGIKIDGYFLYLLVKYIERFSFETNYVYTEGTFISSCVIFSYSYCFSKWIFVNVKSIKLCFRNYYISMYMCD